MYPIKSTLAYLNNKWTLEISLNMLDIRGVSSDIQYQNLSTLKQVVTSINLINYPLGLMYCIHNLLSHYIFFKRNTWKNIPGLGDSLWNFLVKVYWIYYRCLQRDREREKDWERESFTSFTVFIVEIRLPTYCQSLSLWCLFLAQVPYTEGVR